MAFRRWSMSWEDKVRRVEPYVAGEQPKDPGIIKLNTNECPYPPSPEVLMAARHLQEDAVRLRLYPDMDAQPLADALAKAYGVSPDQVFVGVGSDDCLAMCFLTFFTGGKKILFPDITYSFYDVWANLFRIPFEQKALQDDFTIDPEDYLPKDGETYGGIIFPNPNAPTGAELPQDQIEKIIAANPDCVVIVDEAYIDFGGTSALPLLKKYDNLLVVQTFSKSRAMAGARVGFVLGNEKIIRYLKDVKFSFNSYTMNYPSIVLGTAAVQDDAYFREITEKIVETREWFKGELSSLGFDFPDSKANFVFARHATRRAEDLYKALREKKIVVRYFKRPRIDNYLRITIGTREQMEKVAEALREILA